MGKKNQNRVFWVLGNNLNLRKSWVYLIFSITICERIKRNELPKKTLGRLKFLNFQFFSPSSLNILFVFGYGFVVFFFPVFVGEERNRLPVHLWVGVLIRRLCSLVSSLF